VGICEDTADGSGLGLTTLVETDHDGEESVGLDAEGGENP